MDELLRQHLGLILLLAAWSLPWKGVALWRAANRHDTQWFVFLLVVNTLAILDIIYIFIFSKRPQTSTDDTNV